MIEKIVYLRRVKLGDIFVSKDEQSLVSSLGNHPTSNDKAHKKH
jgi:hypothetical protein